MAILTQIKNYKTGDAVTAKVINDTIETAIDAHGKSAAALSAAQLAEGNSQTALTNSTKALTDSGEAKTLSGAANNNSIEALNTSNVAISKATEVEIRANRGDFNGRNAALVETNGMYGFQIIDDNLILNFSGGAEPDFSINENGELIYKF